MTADESGLFMRFAETGLAATVEALYPANDFGAPDFRSTEMVPRMLEYWALLPRRQRRLLMALFTLIELGSVLLISGFRRFSRLPVSRREQAVRDFRRSKLLPLRILGDALKASTTFIYMSHPDVLSHIGMVVVCERPNDRLTVKADRGALGRMSGSP